MHVGYEYKERGKISASCSCSAVSAHHGKNNSVGTGLPEAVKV
jgi:hypothetical protein